MALAENAIDSLSLRPNTILRSHKGLTVEVGNTDAEGRLCLADALSFVQAQYRPRVIVDACTLTGCARRERCRAAGRHACHACAAASRALVQVRGGGAGRACGGPVLQRRRGGAGAAGLGGRHSRARVAHAHHARCAHRRCRCALREPLTAALPEHTEALKSRHADLRNIGPNKWGDACVAAAFLQVRALLPPRAVCDAPAATQTLGCQHPAHRAAIAACTRPPSRAQQFVLPTTKWAHVDMAGPAMPSEPAPCMPPGASGFGAQLLTEFLKRRQAPAGR